MTTSDHDLIDALRAVIGDEALDRARRWNATRPRDASDMDQDALEQSFGGLSAGARRVQRRPRSQRSPEPWMDDLAVAAGDFDPWGEAS